MVESDPLLGFLREEVERIELELDSRLGGSGSRWTYRFTWQEVERARRYRWRLPSGPAEAARGAAGESAGGSIGVGRREIAIRYREGLSAYQVTVRVGAVDASEG